MEWRSGCPAPDGLHSVSPGRGEGTLTWQDLSSASPSHCCPSGPPQSPGRGHIWMEVINLVEALTAPSPADHTKGWPDHTSCSVLSRKSQHVPVGQKLPLNACSPLLALIILFLASEEILYFSTVLLQIFKHLKCFIWHNNLCCIKRFSLNI